MSITRIPISDLTFDAAAAVAKSTAGLSGQSRTEVFQCLDMIQIWHPWFAKTFGQVAEIRHRSAPDDPPDLELIFADGRIVGMEHTRLQPPHLGQADALMRKSGEGGFIPSISSPPKNFAQMKDIVAGVEIPASSVVDDAMAIFDGLAIILRTKMRGMPNGGIIGMIHDLAVSSTNQRMIAEIAENIVNRAEFLGFANYTLILLDRANDRQFHSSLVRRREPIQEKTGAAPPLTPEREQFLAEMLAEVSKLEVAGDG